MAPPSQGGPGAAPTRRQRARGALVGTAVGDALGAPLEGRPGPVPPDEVAAVAAAATPLRHTDDTAMALALAESLLARGGLDEDHLAATFAAHHQRDPDRGYGPAVADLLRRVAAGGDWRVAAAAQFGGAGSFGNGAAMRVAPLAVVAADPAAAAALARRSARTTHTHPDAVDGAAVQAGAITVLLAAPGLPPPGALLDGLAALAGAGELAARLAALRRLVAEGRLAPAAIRQRLGTGVAAVEAVPAALGCFLLHPGSFEAVVLTALGLGGDTDTIAAMAGALSGALLGEAAVPATWAARVEGVDRLRSLADRLDDQRQGG